MTYYDLLSVPHSASDKELKFAYLKKAKRYHPDVYQGVNKDHFKKVNEAYTVLKNAQKRAAYDNRSKIRARQRQGDAENAGNEGDSDGAEQKGQKVRDYQDPEFEEAFRKLNTQRLFDQFMARPIQTNPDELMEEFMVPDHQKNYSKRDKARQ